MRIANLDGRLTLVTTDGAIDVHAASEGRFGPDPMRAFDEWPALVQWARTQRAVATPFDPARLGPPVTAPRQIFAIGLNYVRHAAESGLPVPTIPLVFTKFASSITGPFGEVELPSDNVDWEVELVVVMGREGRNVPEADAWSHVAGLTIGQDFSERVVQSAGSPPQFSLGKSYPGFAPIGPHLVTVDEFADPDDLRVATTVDSQVKQDSRTSDLVFSVPRLVSYLSTIVTLFPGDLIFTGTPEGVGLGQKLPHYLRDGQVVETSIETIGSMRHVMRAAR
jgi:2-keto-4-pentenoate hydratase/2-oxohepta-3-ene-1,7-dioic acid hydratase in catechol pathway